MKTTRARSSSDRFQLALLQEVQPGGQPMPGGTPPMGEAKPETKAPSVEIISRPKDPKEKGDSDQLKLEPDAEGKIRFNFVGQKWPDILEWLAEVSHLSLDWQELPGDFLNLQTQRSYTIEEAQDLINRHLLARGFTMIKSGETLTVTSVAKLNPTFVPRLEPEDLDKRMDYEFVKVSFPMKWILAEQANEELKSMLSSNGKMSAMKGVNRLEVMDAAINLKQINQILRQEQSDDASKGLLVQEFKLKHRRAEEVLTALEGILGIESKRKNNNPSGSGGGDMMSQQLMMQIQQMQQQMQQQQQQGGKPGGGATQEPKLVINERENSILAYAPPDKMEIISQTIQKMDIESDFQAAAMQNVSRVKPYRLTSLEPQPLMNLLKEMGDLSPQARLQVDTKSRSIIVFGTLADHYTVQALILKLDGSNRSFEVIPLRRVQADAVAGTIQYMLGAEEKKADSNSNSRFGYFDYFSSNRNESKTTEERPFRVDADIEKNRLLVWANEAELGEVRQLLAKMGEILPGTSNPQTHRSFRVESEKEAQELLERMKEFWPEVAPNQLQIQISPPAASSAPAASGTTSPQAPTTPAAPEPKTAPIPSVLVEPDRKDVTHAVTGVATQSTTSLDNSDQGSNSVLISDSAESRTNPQPNRRSIRAQFAVLNPNEVLAGQHPLLAQSAAGDTTTIEPEISFSELPTELRGGQPTSPIRIRPLPGGGFVYESEDTAALDRFEELLLDLSPPPKDYQIFHLRYPNTWAYGIELNLKDFFKSTDQKNTTLDWWGNQVNTKKDEPNQLSRRKELKIISDDDSRTILVQGATPQQLKTISDLIQIYDRPTSSDPQAVRRTEIVRLKFSEAEKISNTVKQVYRDLLSASDPALQSQNQGGDQGQKTVTERVISYRGSGSGDSEEKTKEQAQPLRFKGLLSIGVDELSNSVVVSAGEDLLKEIVMMIQELDKLADPQIAVQLIQVQNVNPLSIKQRLDETFSPKVRSSESGRVNHGQEGQPENHQSPQVKTFGQ